MKEKIKALIWYWEEEIKRDSLYGGLGRQLSGSARQSEALIERTQRYINQLNQLLEE